MNKESIFESFIVQKYIAHKGFHNETYPENSLGAFQNAIDNNYAIELDVQLLEDNTVAVFHDNKLARMTNQDGYLRNLTKEDLPNYKLLGTEYSIPTLDEFLQLVDGKVGIIIDIKNSTTKIGKLEKEVCKLIRHYSGDVAVQSMNPLTLEWFAKYAPKVLRGQVSYYFNDDYAKDVSWFRKFILKRMLLNKRSKPDFISYSVLNLPNRYVKKYKNLPLLGWIVKSQEQYRAVASKVDNIIFEGFHPKI